MADNQAEADQTDETVADPFDAANSQNNGTTDLSNYEDEIEAMKQGGEIQLGDDEEQEQSADDEADAFDDFAADLDDETSEEEETDEDEPGAKSQERFRFKSDDDKAVAAIAKAKGVSLVEAARIYSGEQPQARAEETTRQQQSAPSETLSVVESELDALYEKKDAAIRAIDVDEQAELEKQIRQLEKKARVMAITEAEQSARAAQSQLEQDQQNFDASWDFSRNRYPELNDPNSAMYKEVARLDAEMQELGDPLANDPKRLWDLAKRAGLNTRTPMTKARESSPPKKGRTGSPIQPASGNRGTTSADSNQRFEQQVEGLQTLDEYEESVRLMFGRV